MSKLATCEAVVLRTVDIGEADRFCILFTKEFGRVPARAKAVRKLGSRMGGLLLPYRTLQLDMAQGSGGWIITGAKQLLEPPNTMQLSIFAMLQEAMEMVLALTQDDEPLPDIFTLLKQLVSLPVDTGDVLVPFTLRLLHLLGFLPLHGEDARFLRLSPESSAVVLYVATEQDLAALSRINYQHDVIEFCEMLLSEYIERPLRSRVNLGVGTQG